MKLNKDFLTLKREGIIISKSQFRKEQASAFTVVCCLGGTLLLIAVGYFLNI